MIQEEPCGIASGLGQGKGPVDDELRKLQRLAAQSKEDERNYWKALIRSGKMPPFQVGNNKSLLESGYKIRRYAQADSNSTYECYQRGCSHQHFFRWTYRQVLQMEVCNHQHKDKKLAWNCLRRNLKVKKREQFIQEMAGNEKSV